MFFWGVFGWRRSKNSVFLGCVWLEWCLLLESLESEGIIDYK